TPAQVGSAVVALAEQGIDPVGTAPGDGAPARGTRRRRKPPHGSAPWRRHVFRLPGPSARLPRGAAPGAGTGEPSAGTARPGTNSGGRSSRRDADLSLRGRPRSGRGA